LFTYPQ
jgi:hypothetical protein